MRVISVSVYRRHGINRGMLAHEMKNSLKLVSACGGIFTDASGEILTGCVVWIRYPETEPCRHVMSQECWCDVEGSAPLLLREHLLAFESWPRFRLKLPARIFLPFQAQIDPIRIFGEDQRELLFSSPSFDLEFSCSRA